jgi:hypothetical protein
MRRGQSGHKQANADETMMKNMHAPFGILPINTGLYKTPAPN